MRNKKEDRAPEKLGSAVIFWDKGTNPPTKWSIARKQCGIKRRICDVNLVQAAKCLKTRQRVIGTYMDGTKRYTKEYPYIYKITVALDTRGKLIYNAVLAAVLAPSGEPHSLVNVKIEDVRVSPYN